MEYFENMEDQIISKICEMCDSWRDIRFFKNGEAICRRCISTAEHEWQQSELEDEFEEYIAGKLLIKKLVDEGDR